MKRLNQKLAHQISMAALGLISIASLLLFAGLVL